MHDLEIIQKLWKRFADGLIDDCRAKGAADDHQNRLVGMKTAELPCCFFISVQQFFSDRGAGQDALFSRKRF